MFNFFFSFYMLLIVFSYLKKLMEFWFILTIYFKSNDSIGVIADSLHSPCDAYSAFSGKNKLEGNAV